MHEFGVVQAGFGVEHVEVLGHERTDSTPPGLPRGRPMSQDILRVETQLPGTRQNGSDLRSKGACSDRIG